MPLRLRQKLETFASCDIKYEMSRVDEQSGLCEVVEVSQCVPLPDKSKTDLAKMIKAGVKLDDVKCNLLDPIQVVPDVVNSESKTSEVNDAEQ